MLPPPPTPITSLHLTLRHPPPPPSPPNSPTHIFAVCTGCIQHLARSLASLYAAGDRLCAHPYVYDIRYWLARLCFLKFIYNYLIVRVSSDPAVGDRERRNKVPLFTASPKLSEVICLCGGSEYSLACLAYCRNVSALFLISAFLFD